jgi:IMP dehydrogenase
MNNSFDYDNFYIMPKGVSFTCSRNKVNLESNFNKLYPIFSSPMRGISGTELVIEMGKLNCLGIYHRFSPEKDRLKDIEKISSENVPFGISIGINNFEKELKIAEYAVEKGSCLIVVDVANGYLSSFKNIGLKLKQTFGNNIKLMAGNIIDFNGAEHLKDSKFDIARVGIGASGVCTTRNITGIGRSQMPAIFDSSKSDIEIIADGGISESGKACKAFAVGADYVMLGSILAKSLEAEDKNGNLYGMASLKNHIDNNKEIKSIEGIETHIEISEKLPLKEIIDSFLWGIKSNCTYLNCNSYQDIRNNCRIIPVNENIC